jgi:predicted  nucleic acid-binding Zn-ribbon protein
MNNEDKILQLLERMDGRLSSLERGQESLEAEVIGIKRGQESLEAEVIGIKKGQESLEAEVIGIKKGQESLEAEVIGIKRGQESLGAEVVGIKRGQESLGAEVVGIKRGQESLGAEVVGIKRGQESDRGLLELTASQVSKLTMDMDELKVEVSSINKTVVKIENEHGEKLAALFDGYEQNSNKLDRIEKEVSRHEEVILRRIR